MSTNFSSRRQAVIEVLHNTVEHPDAETIFEESRKTAPSISLATVYRNLALLESEGEITKVATVNGRDRYDGNTKPHNHIICPICYRVSDTKCSPKLEDALQCEISQRQMDAYSLNFFAVCDECQKKTKNNASNLAKNK